MQAATGLPSPRWRGVGGEGRIRIMHGRDEGRSRHRRWRIIPHAPHPRPLSARERGGSAASGGEGGWLADALDGVSDPAQAGEDGVGQGAQGMVEFAIVEIGEGHVEGGDEGAQMVEVVGDVEKRDLQFVRERGPGCGRGCGERGGERCGAIRFEQRLHLRDLGGGAANAVFGEDAREPGGVCRGQAVVFVMV